MKKRMKQTVSILLTLTLALTLLTPLQSQAAARVQKLSNGYSFTPEDGIQPIKPVKYGSITRSVYDIDETDSERIKRHTSGKHVSSLEDAADYIRQQIKYHSESITVVMDVYSYEEGDEAEVLSQVWKHTGKGDEGYYLAMQVDSFNIIPYRYRNVTAFFVNMNYLTTLDQEKEATKALQKLEDSLWSDYKGDKEKYLKMMYLFLSSVKYDYDHLEEEENNPNTSQMAHTAYAAIVKKKAVCSGVAASLYRAMLDKGINCLVLVSDNHAWNAVELDGKWYECDPTWDIQKVLKAKYCMITREEMENLESHTVIDAPYYDINALDSLNWSDTKLSGKITKLVASVKKKVLTYTTTNKGKQDVVVKDQDGNVLLEDADYDLTLNPDGSYTVTGTQDKNLTTSGSYQIKLQNPKILSIKMEKKKIGIKRYKVRFVVKVSKVPGAKCYYLEGATTEPATGSFNNTTTGKKQYLLPDVGGASSKTTTLTTGWTTVSDAIDSGKLKLFYMGLVNKNLGTSINRRYNMCFYVQVTNSELLGYLPRGGYCSDYVGGVLRKTKSSVTNPKAYVVSMEEHVFSNVQRKWLTFR